MGGQMYGLFSDQSIYRQNKFAQFTMNTKGYDVKHTESSSFCFWSDSHKTIPGTVCVRNWE